MQRSKSAIMGIWMLIFGAQVMGQQSNVFSLSSEKPQRGEQLTFSFAPQDATRPYTAKRYVFHPSGFNADDVDIVTSERGYSGTINFPDSATALLLSFQDVESGKKSGYFFQAFKGDKPVEGANYALGQIYNGYGESFADIDRDVVKSLAFYRAELDAYPQSANKIFYHYIGLLTTNNEFDEAKEFADHTAAKLFSDESSRESDLISIANTYEYFLKDKSSADSLRAVALQWYPDGSQASAKELTVLREEGDYAKKTELYGAYINKYGTQQSESSLQSLYALMAQAALKEKDYPKFDEYIAKVNNKYSQASLLNQVAWPLAEAGDNLELAAVKSKRSLDLLSEIIADPIATKPATMAASQWKGNAEYLYRNNADTYALILYKQGNLAGALDYQRQAVGEYTVGEFNERFVQFLKESDLVDEAQAVAEKSIEKGQSSEILKGYLEEIYKSKGNDEQQWISYLSALEQRYVAEVRKKLIGEIIDEEAPKFSLVNMEGETVSSESLKGKVYVVDFWATWCGPCKASFPGMQLAVDKFKERDDVEFLFVNTWENIPEREAEVKKFIADNQYSFNVLFDTVEGEGNDFEVVGAYKVSGIPTKFIVDKNGRIRFKAIGFSGSAEGEMQKVALMIELAANPPATAAMD